MGELLQPWVFRSSRIVIGSGKATAMKFVTGIGSVFAIVIAVGLPLNWGAVRSQVSASAVDESFEHCMDGTNSVSEAEHVGAVLGRRFDDVRFDSSILSSKCSDNIADQLFSTYDVGTSVRLVSFLWRAPALTRFLDASIADQRLPCDIACFLLSNGRPLPDATLFYELLKREAPLASANRAALLARSLITRPESSPDKIAQLVGLVEDDRRTDVIKSLYLLSSAEFVNRKFRREGERLCLSDQCVRLGEVDLGKDCERIEERLRAPGGLDEAVGLKAWILASGRSAVYRCIDLNLREPLEDIQNGLVRRVFDLSIFEPFLTFPDVVSGLRSGLFKRTNFLDDNVARFTNLDLTKLRSVSSGFAEAIVSELEQAVTKSGQQVPDLPANVRMLIGQTTSAVRLDLFLCRRSVSSDVPKACDRGQLYTSAISRLDN